MTAQPFVYVLDPKDEADVQAFLKHLSDGYKISAASATADRVVYVLLKISE